MDEMISSINEDQNLTDQQLQDTIDNLCNSPVQFDEMMNYESEDLNLTVISFFFTFLCFYN